jgi:hypothetical protein
MRKLDVVVQLRAGPDPSHFEPAMPLVGRLMLRGEKPPGGGIRCRLAASVGCSSR